MNLIHNTLEILIINNCNYFILNTSEWSKKKFVMVKSFQTVAVKKLIRIFVSLI